MGKSNKLLDSSSLKDSSQVTHNETQDPEDNLYNFDPSKTANLSEAKIHKKAQQVRKLKDQELCPYTDRCKCCLLPFKGPKFSITTDILELGELGAGFPLFFYFVKFITFMLTVLFLIAGIACLIGNLTQNDIEEWNKYPNSIIRTTNGNYGKNSSEVLWQPVLHIIAGMIFFVLHGVFINKMKDINLNVDVFNTSPADFAIKVNHLPKNYDKDDLKKHFEDMSNTLQQPIEVLHVIPAYDIKYLLQTNEELYKLREIKSYIQTRIQTGMSESKARKYQSILCFSSNFYIGKHSKLNEIDVEINLLLNQRDNILYQRDKEHTTSTAFVIFKTQLAAKKIIQQQEIGRLRKFRRDFSFKKRQTKHYFEKIEVEKAPEPSDIYWINLRVNPMMRFGIKMFVYAVLLAALFGSFVIILTLNSVKNDSHRVISILGSILLFLLNAVLSKLVRLLTRLEMHDTWSDYTRSVTNKLIFIVCLNTIVIPFVVNSDMDDWYDNGGLAEDIFYVIVANAIIPSLAAIINLGHIFKLLKRYSLQLRASDDVPLNISQSRANELYEGPELDLSSRTAHIVKTFILCITYSSIVPVAIPISISGLIIEYWISKLMLLRVHTRPRNYGNEIFGNTDRWIKIGILIHSIMVMVFYSSIVELPYQSYGYVYIYFAIQFLFCPVEAIVDKLRKEDTYAIMENLLKDDEIANNYTRQLPFFYTDYLRENPVTELEGWKQWLTALMISEKSEEKKQQLSKLMEKTQAKDADERLHDWRKNHSITPHTKRTKRVQYHIKINEIIDRQKFELQKSSQISKWGLAIMMIRKRKQEEESKSSIISSSSSRSIRT